MTDGLTAWLDLEDRLLNAGRQIECAFIAVNETHALVPFRQSALWSSDGGVLALSGASTIEHGSPYVLWLAETFKHLAEQGDEARRAGAVDLSPALAEQWQEWLPAFAAFVSLKGEALLFARAEPFSDEEIRLLERLGKLACISRRALAPQYSLTAHFKRMNRRKLQYIGGAALAMALFPVTGSVLAPAEAVPAHPAVARVPLEGVIDKVHVAPNQAVKEGQLLFELDSTNLVGRLNVAREELATAETEYLQTAQAMVTDAKAKSRAALLASKANEKKAEVSWIETQLARIQVHAPKAGIAVFDDPADWIGQPVMVGEKVMLVADETDSEVEAWVSPADIGEISQGAKLTLFLNAALLSPLSAKVRSVAYEAMARPDGTAAYRVRAVLEDGEKRPRLGLKGTARVDGGTVPLIWWLLRKPLVAVRQFIGI